ncbi:MAG TPA: anti-sigma factor [Hyphomicrobiales bacterium]|nr:anti-sigma factor [Hyphomicrobiales bacterium]
MSEARSQTPCHEWAATLHGLFDDELDAVHAMKCEEHVANCKGCHAELGRLQVLRGIMSRDDVRWRAPEALRARILADSTRYNHVRTQKPIDPYGNSWSRFMAALQRWGFVPSFVVLAVSLFIVFGPLTRGEVLPDELVAGHVRSLLADHLTDVASSNRHVVKPWFIGKLDFAPPVIDLNEQGFPLIGGRIDYIDEHLVAALVYRRHSHIINLFIWPTTTDSRSAVVREGYNLMNWTQGGLTFWAVTDLDADELNRFQQALAAATSS